MSPIFKVSVVIVGFLLVVLAYTIPILNRIAEIERKSEVKINNQIIVVDVVSKPKDRQKGLSGRNSLGINEGMLFVFPKKGNYGFWMKDMVFPIDIIWIADNKIVGIEENVQPESGVEAEFLTPYFPPEPVNKVLEVRAGRARLLKAKPGDEVKIKPIVPLNL